MTREARTTDIASTMTARSVRRALKSASDPGRAITVARFFKTGRGEYGEGDRFIGVTVPSQRAIARRFRDLPLEQVDSLLTSPIHEERSTALLIMVDQFNRAEGPAARRQVFRLYMRCLRYINNWDLVDTSAPTIVGGWIAFQRSRSPRRSSQSTVPGQNNADLLERLARARHLWSRRIAMIATLQFIVRGDHRDAIRIATLLVHDQHDLIQKAVGWMLREVGKRASADALTEFLSAHAATMPRTTLRYAIERLPADERAEWMNARRAADGRGRASAGRTRWHTD